MLGSKMELSSVSVKHSEENSILGGVLKIGEYWIEISRVCCGLYYYTHSLAPSEEQCSSLHLRGSRFRKRNQHEHWYLP